MASVGRDRKVAALDVRRRSVSPKERAGVPVRQRCCAQANIRWWQPIETGTPRDLPLHHHQVASLRMRYERATRLTSIPFFGNAVAPAPRKLCGAPPRPAGGSLPEGKGRSLKGWGAGEAPSRWWPSIASHAPVPSWRGRRNSGGDAMKSIGIQQPTMGRTTEIKRGGLAALARAMDAMLRLLRSIRQDQRGSRGWKPPSYWCPSWLAPQPWAPHISVQASKSPRRYRAWPWTRLTP